MFCSHPFFHIDRAWWILKLISSISFIPLDKYLFLRWVVILFEIWFKMLKQSYFLLQFLRKACKTILSHDILFFVSRYSFSFIIVKLGSRWFCNNFCRVVEENTSTEVGYKISKTILARVINPFSNPNLCSLVDVSCNIAWCSWSWLHFFMTSIYWLSHYRIPSTCSFWA